MKKGACASHAERRWPSATKRWAAPKVANLKQSLAPITDTVEMVAIGEIAVTEVIEEETAADAVTGETVVGVAIAAGGLIGEQIVHGKSLEIFRVTLHARYHGKFHVTLRQRADLKSVSSFQFQGEPATVRLFS